MIEGDERRLLEPGDGLAFGPPCDVVLANEADTPCRYVVALHRR